MTMMTMKSLLRATILCLGTATSGAFSAQTSSRSTTTTTQMFLLHRHAEMVRTGEAYFQLEEMEDREVCTTELFLQSDHSVAVGQTNGPRFVSASGTWRLLNGADDDNYNDEVELTIQRNYETGRDRVAFTDVGKFSFSVERRLVGRITQVGSVMAIEGTIHDLVTDGSLQQQQQSTTAEMDRVLGYFSMIDTTKTRNRLFGGEDDDDDDDTTPSYSMPPFPPPRSSALQY